MPLPVFQPLFELAFSLLEFFAVDYFRRVASLFALAQFLDGSVVLFEFVNLRLRKPIVNAIQPQLFAVAELTLYFWVAQL